MYQKAKLLIFIMLTLLLLTGSVYALRINEVELNPEGSDFGNEWIEFYSEIPMDLEGYSIENNDGEIYFLTGVFFDYITIPLDYQWLDNSNERVILKDPQGNVIDETPAFNDSDDNLVAWSWCSLSGGSWLFIPSTISGVNGCPTSGGSGGGGATNPNAFTTNWQIEVNGEEIDDFGDETIILHAGEINLVDLAFTATRDMEDVRVIVRIEDSRDRTRIYDASERFDILNGSTYARTLELEVPLYVNLNEEYTMEISIESGQRVQKSRGDVSIVSPINWADDLRTSKLRLFANRHCYDLIC